MATQIPNPYAALKKQQPVQPSTVMNRPGVPAPQLAQRPAQAPAVRTATPGPATGEATRTGTGSTIAAAPKPAGDAVQPGAGASFTGTTPANTGGVIRPVQTGQPAAPAAPDIGGLGYDLYGRGGGTRASAQEGSLEAGLRDYITQGMQGVTSKQFVDRSKQDLAAATEGGRAQAVNRVNEDAIRRGLFQSGIPSEQAAAAGRAAQSSFATGLADILKSAEQQNIAGRESAAGQAANLLSQNRSYDQYTQQRIDEENARRRASSGGGPSTFTYIDPDTGTQYELPNDF